MKYSIDGGKVFTQFRKHDNLKKVVPIIGFGIISTPQFNPSTDNTNFQNTAAYFSVNCEIVIEYDADSNYHSKYQCAFSCLE